MILTSNKIVPMAGCFSLQEWGLYKEFIASNNSTSVQNSRIISFLMKIITGAVSSYTSGYCSCKILLPDCGSRPQASLISGSPLLKNQ